METLLILILWFFGAFIAGAMAKNKTLGFGKAFLISIILSPVVGIIAAIVSADEPPPAAKDNITRISTPGYRQQTAPFSRDAPFIPPSVAANMARTEEEAIKSAPLDMSIAKQIAEWKALLDSGAITQDEYDKQKTKLLKQ